MANNDKGVLIARDVAAIDQAALKARSRSGYAHRKAHSARATDSHPVVDAPFPNAVARAIQGLDAITLQTEALTKTLNRLADEVRDGKRTLENAQAEADRLFPGVDSDTIDLSRIMASGQAMDSGLTPSQVIDSL